MNSLIDPKQFSLPARTVLKRVDAKTIAIVIDRKSRIIMADGRKILEKARKILQVLPGTAILVKTSAPVCSKTITFLESEGIEVENIK